MNDEKKIRRMAMAVAAVTVAGVAIAGTAFAAGTDGPSGATAGSRLAGSQLAGDDGDGGSGGAVTPPADDPFPGGTVPPADPDPEETALPTEDPNPGDTAPPTEDPNPGETGLPTEDPGNGEPPTEEPTPEWTPTPSTPAGILCWSGPKKDPLPIAGSFTGMVPPNVLPRGNDAMMIDLKFVPNGYQDDLMEVAFRTPKKLQATPVKWELDWDKVKPFRPVVPGQRLKMPEITLNDVNCWGYNVSSVGGMVRFGGEGGNGGPEVTIPVTWYRSE